MTITMIGYLGWMSSRRRLQSRRYESIDSSIFFSEIKESKMTRGHNYTLVKKQSRLDVRKYSFSQRTIND